MVEQHKYWWKDEWDMIREGENPDSWRDSIGRNFDAYLASDCKDEELVEAVWKCFKDKPCTEWQRHPYYKCDDLSRDHISYALLLFIAAYKFEYASYILDNFKWRINKHTTLRGMYMWLRCIKKDKGYSLYHIYKIPGVWFKRALNWVVRYEAEIKPERSQAEWDVNITRNRTEKQRKASKWVFPAYALHNFAWQTHVLPNSKLKSYLQKISLPLAGKHNYVIKALLGHTLTAEELKLASEYKSMTSSRWTTTLDELSSRGVELIDPERIGEYDLDKGYLDYIIELTQ